jgi:hypothetical protein
MATVMLAMGVDIGQKRDPTAIGLLEGTERVAGERFITEFECRFLERMPLGTSYPDVARRVAEIKTNAIHKARQAVFDRTGDPYPEIYLTTYVDATGVGQPIVDLLTEQDVEVRPCYFTYGDRRTEDTEKVTIGKAWLVSRLQALFQSGRIRLPADHPESTPLRNELLDYEIRVDQNANDRYGAFKVGAHDDLVTAVGLAAQVDPPFAEQRQWQAIVDHFNRGYTGGWR